MSERHETRPPAGSVPPDRLPLPHDPPPPPGYVDPLGEEGILSDLTMTAADADVSGAGAGRDQDA
ncbi:hypothetical protein [Phycicoccus sp. 3266]|uniref:hypothetical protein n=1 Tax=Phycicoccus sp. 3266 TaxID=2817751 RepID=UPI00285D7F43|nr:hypothetical protein [Phycicoccus sp. 3266]MDR6862639.1 hypothetical protein [Phycicoccus sp. 3266]